MPYIGQKPADIISTAVDTVTGAFSGNVTAGGTLGVTGAVTANAGVVVDNITIDGQEIDVSSGDLNLDVAGDINLDTDAGEINLKDGGTLFGLIINSSTDLVVQSATQDKDLIFKGNDGGAVISALTLDMSAAGKALFNNGATFASNIIMAAGTQIQMSGDGGSSGLQLLGNDSDVSIVGSLGSQALVLRTASTERLRILSDGRIGHGATAAISGAHFSQTYNSVNGAGFNLNSVDASGNMHSQIIFRRNGGNVGSIDTNGSSTQFSTSSDYRLKENVTTSWDATTRLKQLKPSRFNFKIDADTTVDGFLAHEVSSIVPEAITGTKDGTEDITNVILNADGTVNSDGVSQSDWTTGKLAVTDGDGNTIDPIYASDTTWVASKTIPKYQGIDQSKLVPLLTKALQEQQATIEALTARIVTLEKA
jgi:cytoskeletal protein CcmA (bactofilin family)